MTSVLGAIYGIAILGFFIAAGVHWISRRKEIRSCSRLAAAFVAVYAVVFIAQSPVGIEGPWPLMVPWLIGVMSHVVVMWQSAWIWPYLFLSVALLSVDFLWKFLLTAVGLSCCVAAGVAAFPFLRPDLGARENFVRPSPFAPVAFSLLLAATWSAYSVLLFSLTSPELTDISRQSDVGDSTAMAILGVSVVALGEELVYRLGIQNYIARVFGWWDRRYWLAILLSATLWSLGYVGTLEPDWVKLAQVFPAGLALGWLARKHGIEACILAHVMFSVAALMMAEAGILGLG